MTARGRLEGVPNVEGNANGFDSGKALLARGESRVLRRVLLGPVSIASTSAGGRSARS